MAIKKKSSKMPRKFEFLADHPFITVLAEKSGGYMTVLFISLTRKPIYY